MEEKIVERAQKKLRLDTLVVQTGRLPETSKALTKEEMLEMVRNGASDIFRAQGEVTGQTRARYASRLASRYDSHNKFNPVLCR